MATGTARSGINAMIMIDESSAGTSPAVGVSSKNAWTWDGARDQFDTTSFGDTGKTSVLGFANNTGTIGGTWDASDNNFYNLIGSTVERNLKIYPDYTNNSTTYLTGKAWFSGSLSGSVGDAVKCDLTYVAGPTGLSWAHP